MKHAYSNQSLSALKALWQCAKSLPRVHAPPQQVHDSRMSSINTLNPLSRLDCDKPLVVDVGCGVGSFAIGFASRAEAHAAHQDHDETSRSLAAAKLLSADYSVIAVDVSRVAVRRCTGVASRLGLSHRCASDAQLHYVSYVALYTFGNRFEHVQPVCMSVCRVAFLHMDAVQVLQWVRASYQGVVALVHIGFPTPFATRSSKSSVLSGNARTVHNKPEFMVQARFPDTAAPKHCLLMYRASSDFPYFRSRHLISRIIRSDEHSQSRAGTPRVRRSRCVTGWKPRDAAVQQQPSVQRNAASICLQLSSQRHQQPQTCCIGRL